MPGVNLVHISSRSALESVLHEDRDFVSMFTIELVVSRTVLHTVSTQIFEFHAFCCDVLLKISLSTYWISLWCWLLSWLQLSAPDVTFTGSIRIKNTGSYKQSTLLNPSELSHKTLVSSDFSATFALT